MATESRVKKTLLNARVNLIFYLLTLILSFFSRKIFLDCLGAGFIGLTGTMYNLLGFLNLAELGIGTAIGFLLYKPIFNRDEIKINEIISVMGYMYHWIGYFIAFTGCVLACFLPFIFSTKDTGFSLSLIYFTYFSFLTSSLIGYFVNYRQCLLGADQKNYVVTAYFQTSNIIKSVLQMASAYYTQSYYLWVFIELSFGIIYSFILNWKINQTYPWLRAEIKSGRKLFKKYPEVMKYTRQLFVHRMGNFVEYQITPILIYSVVSLKMVAFYENYNLLISKLNGVINSLFTGMEAGIGNLIAEGNIYKIKSVFWEINSLRYYIAGLVVFILSKTLSPFISIWLGNEYVLPNAIVYIIIAYTYFRVSNGYNLSFVYGYGLFADIWAPIAEAILNVIFAIILGLKLGLAGVLMGPFISFFIIICIWKPIYLYRKGFKEKNHEYWIKSALLIAEFFVSAFIAQIIYGIVNLHFEKPIFDFIYNGFYAVIIFGIIHTLLMFSLFSSFRNTVFRFIKRK